MKVPTAQGTRWATGPVISWDTRWPYVNIYCEGSENNPHGLYLVGMFEISKIVLSEQHREMWTFSSRYVTGDNSVISLHSRRANTASMSNPVSTVLDGDEVIPDMEALNRLTLQGNDSEVRSTYKLHCKECDLQVMLRSDNPIIPTIGQTMARAGLHEMSLHGVSQRAKHATVG